MAKTFRTYKTILEFRSYAAAAFQAVRTACLWRNASHPGAPRRGGRRAGFAYASVFAYQMTSFAPGMPGMWVRLVSEVRYVSA